MEAVLDTDLDVAPTYRALSYPCGDAEEESEDTPVEGRDLRQKNLIINRKRFYVFRNLHDALHQIRDDQVVVYYWINAICINQLDLAERSAQVNNVGTLFSQAEKVLVWLGKSDEYSRSVAERIAGLASLSEKVVDEMYDEQHGGDLYDFENPKVVQDLGLPPVDDNIWLQFI